MAFKRKKGKSVRNKNVVGKVSWTGKTKSGKGKVFLSTIGSKKGVKSVKTSITPYKSWNRKTGKKTRKMLVITTTTKVVS